MEVMERWVDFAGEVGQELFSTQNFFFFPVSFFLVFLSSCAALEFSPLSVKAFKAAPAFIFKSMWVFQEFFLLLKKLLSFGDASSS